MLIELSVGQVIDHTTGAACDDHAEGKDHPYFEPELARSVSRYGQCDPGRPEEHDPADWPVEPCDLDPERNMRGEGMNIRHAQSVPHVRSIFQSIVDGCLCALGGLLLRVQRSRQACLRGPKISHSERKFTGLPRAGHITWAPEPEVGFSEHKTIIGIFDEIQPVPRLLRDCITSEQNTETNPCTTANSPLN